MLEERLLRLLDTEQLSSSKFADVIGVQRSSVSHILSGRNKPSFDFIQKTLKAFPYLRAEWLILGEGKMYDTEEISGGGSLFDQTYSEENEISEKEKETTPSDYPKPDKDNTAINEAEDEIAEPSGSSTVAESVVDNDPGIESTESAVQGTIGGRKIKRVVILYNDNTFDSYEQES